MESAILEPMPRTPDRKTRVVEELRPRVRRPREKEMRPSRQLMTSGTFRNLVSSLLHTRLHCFNANLNN